MWVCKYCETENEENVPECICCGHKRNDNEVEGIGNEQKVQIGANSGNDRNGKNDREKSTGKSRTSCSTEKQLLLVFGSIALALIIAIALALVNKARRTGESFSSIVIDKTNKTTSTPTARPGGQTIPQNVKVGETVTFGHYPQTSSGMDKTPIEWQVVEVKGDTALLLSKYVLNWLPFNSRIGEDYSINGSDADEEELSWEKSTLREWLNGEFFNDAFEQDEKKSIIETKLNNARDDTGCYFNDGGVKLKDTQDRVFIMSFEELDRYFELDDELCMDSNTVAMPTKYAVSKGAYELTWDDADLYIQLYGDVFSPKQPPIGACGWWLRSFSGIWVYQVDAVGSVDINACIDVFEKHGVRPTMWVKLG